jgi:ATP-dependent RNA helicase DDX51/DBP6
MIICESTDKPLVLFYLLHRRAVTNALIFTKSAESTARLMHLFDFFEKSWASDDSTRQPVVAQAYSSDLTPGERKSILDRFKDAKISV